MQFFKKLDFFLYLIIKYNVINVRQDISNYSFFFIKFLYKVIHGKLEKSSSFMALEILGQH